MYCENCGAKLNEGAKYCLKCGAPVSIVAQAKSVPEAKTPNQEPSGPKVTLDLDSLGQEVVKPQPAPISLTLDDMDAARAEAAKIKAEANAKANTIAESFSQQVAAASQPEVKPAPQVEPAPAASAAPGAAIEQPPRVAPATQINPERKMQFETTPKIDVSADPGVQRTNKPAAGPEQPSMPKAPQKEIRLQVADAVPKAPKQEIKLTAEPLIDVSDIPEVQKTTKAEINLTAEPEIRIPTLPDDNEPQEPVKAEGQPVPDSADIPEILKGQPEQSPRQPLKTQAKMDGQPGWTRTEQTHQAGASGYHQAGQFAALEKELSTGKTLGILSIVFGIIIPIVGLILGIIGMNKMNKLMVPPQLEEQRLHAKKLNKIGLIIAIIVIVLGIIARIALEMYAMSGVTYIYN